MRQQSFQKTNWNHRFCHGGSLRKSIHGRGARPLSTRDPLHVVFKLREGAVLSGLRSGVTYTRVNFLLKKYSAKFFVKVEQVSINSDHIHLLLRGSKRSLIQNFLRVFAGQVAQTLTDTFHQKKDRPGIWKARPWTRVIRGFKPYKIVRNYIQLNILEASGQRPYRKERLRGLSNEDLDGLWS